MSDNDSETITDNNTETIIINNKYLNYFKDKDYDYNIEHIINNLNINSKKLLLIYNNFDNNFELCIKKHRLNYINIEDIFEFSDFNKYIMHFDYIKTIFIGQYAFRWKTINYNKRTPYKLYKFNNHNIFNIRKYYYRNIDNCFCMTDGTLITFPKNLKELFFYSGK